ncbi:MULTISPECIES: hypothetical protein [Prevotellaceae]|jgi:hypothetical protein|uniref:hypothetical protein n=1 Tax=Prevotellaceae TaxID=171552 RepID=UPI002585E518|nr:MULTISPECIES: hypothetical protein [Prevotellaceae]WOF86595.1 hypothetical protein RJT05_10545 [Segatella copri]WOF92858.1 hypothetical protein RJT10_10280 [Segatella copri]
MSTIKNPTRFAELEYCLQGYFDGKLAPVMKQVRDELTHKQLEERGRYQSSLAGVLASANPYVNNTEFVLKQTGKWNSKTTEDYLAMCNQKIWKDKNIVKDLALLAGEWRNAVVKEIGRSKYDALSKACGEDLAYAYVAQRMEDLMIGKLVKDNTPKSTMDYILRKAAQNSIWGLQEELMKSPLTAEIEARGEKAYKPSKTEKFAGRATASVMDAVTMGGIGSWKSLATLVGSDMALGYILDSKKGNGEQRKEQAMELSISKGVFGQNGNAFTGFRSQAKKVNATDNGYVKTLNSKLHNKIHIPQKAFTPMAWTDNSFKFPFQKEQEKRNDPKYKNVPLIVAPGKEDAYLEEKAKHDAAKIAEAERIIKERNETEALQEDAEQQQSEETQQEQPERDNSNGWEGLLKNFGLNGFSDIGNNLGYVIAMLPDILVGLFTGKTQSLGLKDNMMPIAAILAGMFVKNPLLKMTLIGMGGANLLNKAGHEALANKRESNDGNAVSYDNTTSQAVQYKSYPDEPLNPRIVNPVLQGNCLVATIDRVPYTIQLPEHVVGAYQAGALPLNTLANAVLAKSDQMRQMAERNYGEQEVRSVRNEAMENAEQREVIQRSR